MTALREKMINMVTDVAEEQIPQIILFIENIQKDEAGKRNNSAEGSIRAYQNLQKYRRRGTRNIDYKREVAKAIGERYESIG